MIDWCIIEESGLLPDISIKDAFRQSQKYSDRVLVWIENAGDASLFAFATYIHSINQWKIEGMTGSRFTVIAWSYVQDPKAKTF